MDKERDRAHFVSVSSLALPPILCGRVQKSRSDLKTGDRPNRFLVTGGYHPREVACSRVSTSPSESLTHALQNKAHCGKSPKRDAKKDFISKTRKRKKGKGEKGNEKKS